MTSMLDDDLYKFTMAQAVLKAAPNAMAEYRFTNRGTQHFFSEEFFCALRSQVSEMTNIKATDEELQWLSSLPFITPWFVDYIANYRYDPSEVSIRNRNGHLEVKIRGPWRRTILWEVKLLSLISELYFQIIDVDWDTAATWDEQALKIGRKAAHLSGTHYADFGTRRRRSFKSQNTLVDLMRRKSGFVGTSNMHLAMEYGIKPIGTMAHEWPMAWSVLAGLRNANRYALQSWSDMYGGNLGIALTDTFGSDAFFRNFTLQYAKLYDGVRHDSGCPFDFIEKTISHYQRLGIDPTTKTIIFSDGLKPDLAVRLNGSCSGRIKAAFGIGTNFTNDFATPALNIVIKLRKLNGVDVVKLSDDDGKATGDADAIRVARWVFNNTPLD